MKPIIIVDIDDYLISWTPEYIKWLFENKYNNIDTYIPSSWFYEIYVKQFNSSTIFMYGRQANYTLASYLSTLKDRYTFIAISSCGNKKTQKLAISHILYPFNLFDKIKILPLGTDKFEQIIKLQPEFVLDDNRTLCDRINIETNAIATYKKTVKEVENFIRYKDVFND